jgi:hypothetical protein
MREFLEGEGEQHILARTNRWRFSKFAHVTGRVGLPF